FEVFFFSEEVEAADPVFFLDTGLNHHVTLVVDDLIELLAREAQQVADLVRQRAEIPDVSDGNNQFDMSHTFPSHLLFRNLDTAAVADDALVPDALVFAAVAFPILYGTEYPLAKQTAHFRLVCSVVDCLRLSHLAVRAFQD